MRNFDAFSNTLQKIGTVAEKLQFLKQNRAEKTLLCCSTTLHNKRQSKRKT